MKKLIFAFLTISVLASNSAHAQWLTKLDENLFTGKQDPIMMGMISQRNFIYIQCSADGNPEISYVEQVSEDSNVPAGVELPVGNMIIKADTGQRWAASAKMYQHNNVFIGMKHDDAENARQIIEEIGKANGKVLLGLDLITSDEPFNASIPARGSTKAAKLFLANCVVE